MKSLLLQLYDGEVFPAEQYTPKIEEYRKLDYSGQLAHALKRVQRMGSAV